MATLFGMPGNMELAEALAVLTGSEVGLVETRRFPDGESYVRIQGVTDGNAFLVCTLVRPDEQFLPLIYAARAMRESGAKRVTLIAPYLAYLRQDRQFHAGEAVSSLVFADLLSREFDALVTVDPHLHRYRSLREIYSIPATVVHTADLIGAWVRDNVDCPLIIGPDEESGQWAERVARSASCPWTVFRKERHGDREVRLTPPSLDTVLDRTPVLIDDIISSGATMVGAAKLLLDAGLSIGFCVAVHALFDNEELGELSSQFQAIVTSDSVPHRFSRFKVAPLIAGQLDLADPSAS